MENLSFIWVLPFGAILLGIALLPLVVPHFWENNKNKAYVCLGLALPVGFYLVVNNPGALGHTVHEYFSFIILLASLFVASGGIHLEGDLKATPLINTFFLALGSVLANLIGTTGASMLLIRTFLKTNSERHHVAHLPVFFIFIVSNIGGLLTPIGDPPLFLGFLRGVPFFWTLKLFPIWLLCIGVLLVLFFIVDAIAYRRETRRDIRRDATHVEPLSLVGTVNFVFLSGIIAGVFLPTPYREVEMVLMAVLSLWFTSKKIRKKNAFSFGPIIEVAVIFAGIFIAMVPALELLKMHSPEMGITKPWQFFWLTGVLSSFLDNAPTYLTFFTMGQGLHLPHAEVAGLSGLLLEAISAGAVLMGANTYIGNGPNFMVKAIADAAGLKTPSFFGYMIYSVGILIPLFLLITWVFFV